MSITVKENINLSPVSRLSSEEKCDGKGIRCSLGA